MLQALRRLTEALGQAVDLDEALALAVRGVKEQLAVDACSIYIADASGHCFVLAATDGFDPRAVGTVRFEAGEGLVGWVVERQSPVSLSNAQNHPRYRHRSELSEKTLHGFLGVPITHLRKPLGALIARQLNDRQFDRSEEAFAVAVAGELAGLIESQAGTSEIHARLHRGDTGRELRGIKGAPGVGVGIAVLPAPAANLDGVPDAAAADVALELKALQRAVGAVREELRRSGERMASRIPADVHAMFGVFSELLDDDALLADAFERVRAGASAPSALRQSIAAHVQHFEQMDDPYLRARAEDLRGLGRRVLLQLQPGSVKPRSYPDRCVLVGEEVSIARIADVPAGQLAGIVCSRGSAYSHAAILARTLGVPAVMGLGGIALDSLDGRTLAVDGDHGRIQVDPAQDAVAAIEHARTAKSAALGAGDALRDLPARMRDGARISLQANAGLFAELAAVRNSGAEGIGLFRTEFAFMASESFPTEDEQCRAYREVLMALAPHRVTIRTLDIGGDKALPYFPIEEANAFLGWRGIRLALDNPGVFLTQLRALLRANRGLGNLQVLLPMISSVAEVDATRDLIERATTECARAGHAVTAFDLGAMIEVPAAIYQVQALASRVAFFSIGTNDLTQYLLAVDRSNARVSRHFDSLHPAVLRAIDTIARAARQAGRPVAVCGEMAGEPDSAVLLAGLGIPALSMAAPCIPRVKRALLSIALPRARAVAAQAMDLETPAQVHRLLRQEFGADWPPADTADPRGVNR